MPRPAFQVPICPVLSVGHVLEAAACLLMAMDVPGAVHLLLEHGHVAHAMAVAAARLLATDPLLLATRVAFADNLERQGLKYDAAACFWAGMSCCHIPLSLQPAQSLLGLDTTRSGRTTKVLAKRTLMYYRISVRERCWSPGASVLKW